MEITGTVSAAERMMSGKLVYVKIEGNKGGLVATFWVPREQERMFVLGTPVTLTVTT